MSPDLRKFLTDWLAWAEGGQPYHPIFRGHFGLSPLARQTGGARMQRELDDLVLSTTGDDWPFGGRVTYARETRDDALPRNPQRLAWVREQLA